MASELVKAATSPGTSGTPGTPGSPNSLVLVVGTRGRATTNQITAGLSEDPKTREQVLRERYLKGLKKRKCTVCGNIARARCPYRACKTCCTRGRNACTVHVLKENKRSTESHIVHPPFTAPPSYLPEQPWLPLSLQASAAGSEYLRPGYSLSSPFNVPTATPMDVDGTASLDAAGAAASRYPVPGSRLWSNNAVVDQQELQRMKNLRVATQKEVIVTNLWRIQKMKDHAAGEISAENVAFNRYMLNSFLLGEVFAINGGVLEGIDSDDKVSVKVGDENACRVGVQNGDTISFLDAMRAQFASHPKRKEASRQKLKQLMDRAFKRFRNAEQEPETIADDEDGMQAGISGTDVVEKKWEPKRFKAKAEKGKHALKTIEAFDALMQTLNQIKSIDGVQACMDQYKRTVGGNLSYLIPNLYPKEDTDACAISGTGKSIDGSLISPRATLLNYLSGAYLEANPAGQVIINNRNKTLSASGTKNSFKVKERPWENGVEKLERLHWHRKYLRGVGWWKVHAHDEIVHGMCFERANANTTILEL